MKESLFAGMTANAIKLGTVLSLGWFWMRPDGCHNIYRGQDGEIDYDNVQAVMSLEDEQVSIPGQNLPANTIWHYLRRQVSGCGLESDDSPVCIIQIDANGDMLDNAPNPPLDLLIEKVAGGKLKLKWRYSPLDQAVAPSGFNIYMDDGSGFDFTDPLDTVGAGGGAGEFTWTSTALVDGQLYKFCVRSYATNAGESQNTKFVAARADSQGPEPVSGVRLTWEEI